MLFLNLPRRQRSQPRQLCIRPWRYFPSLLQRWPVTQLREDMPRRPSEPHDRPSWRLPSPGASRERRVDGVS